jgi:hypothetical protein
LNSCHPIIWIFQYRDCGGSTNGVLKTPRYYILSERSSTSDIWQTF